MSDHDEKCERDERGFRLCHCSKRRREARGLTEVPTEDLYFSPPDCPVCDRELVFDGDGWCCYFDSLAWSSDGVAAHFTDDYGEDLDAMADRWRAANGMADQ